jgi:DNA-binding Xre family transcriptional regulator
MEFLLFSKISFEIPEPIALIECYCYQNNFYAKYDLLLEHKDRKIEDVNKIGARIKKEVFLECKIITENTKSLSIFKYNLEQFLRLEEKDRDEQITELNDFVIQKLLKIKGIALSTTTKILHTLYPKIIPMIDKPLQNKYREKINNVWTEKRADEIFIDFYNNLKKGSNRKNLNYIFKEVSKNNLKNLSRIRIFDILWWSYLKAEKLREEKGINWNTIKFINGGLVKKIR